MDLGQFVRTLLSEAAQLIHEFGHFSSVSVGAHNAHSCNSPH